MSVMPGITSAKERYKLETQQNILEHRVCYLGSFVCMLSGVALVLGAVSGEGALGGRPHRNMVSVGSSDDS